MVSVAAHGHNKHFLFLVKPKLNNLLLFITAPVYSGLFLLVAVDINFFCNNCT